MDQAVAQEIRDEWLTEGLPRILRDEPDRTDLMIPLHRAASADLNMDIDHNMVKAAVIEVYGVAYAELFSRERSDSAAIEARQMCAYIMCRFCGITRSAAGRAMQRDHSTIRNNLLAIEARAREPVMARRIQRVLKVLGIIEG